MLTHELRYLLASTLTPARPSLTRSYSALIHSKRPLRVLALESSADDTCASIVTSSRAILSNIVMKQPIHDSYGGIHPLHAQEAHQRNMPLAIQAALQEAGLGLGELDAVAFTRGPGMYGCLGVAAGAAKALAAAAGLPLVGVHHMQAHALTPLLTEEIPPAFPFLTLLVSGGHTQLVLARSESSFQILAKCDDESIGASFDKASRALEIPRALGHGSQGAALEAFAAVPSPLSESTSPSPSPDYGPFPLPFRGQLAFSYSGLRSALTRILDREPVETMSEEKRRELARQFMGAAVGQVEEKVGLAMRWWEGTGGGKLGALVASGGVASNQFLRMRLRHKLDKLGYHDLRLVFPPPHLCTDNAAMIANVALSRLRRGRVDELTVMQRAKWSIEDCEADFEEPERMDRAETPPAGKHPPE